MKFFGILLVMFVAGCSWLCAEQNEFAENVKRAEKLFWLTPVYGGRSQYIFLEISDVKIKETLIGLFSRAEKTEGIDYLLLNGEPPDAGYLIFSGKNGDVVVHVIPFSRMPLAANVATIKSMRPGRITIETRSLSGGIRVEKDFRGILKRISRPPSNSHFGLFEVDAKLMSSPSQ